MLVSTLDGFTTAFGVSVSATEAAGGAVLPPFNVDGGVGATSSLAGTIIGICGGATAAADIEEVGTAGPEEDVFFSRVAGWGWDTGTLVGRGVGNWGLRIGG